MNKSKLPEKEKQPTWSRAGGLNHSCGNFLQQGQGEKSIELWEWQLSLQGWYPPFQVWLQFASLSTQPPLHTWLQDHDFSLRHKRGHHLGDDLIICFQLLKKKKQKTKNHKNPLFRGHKVILGIKGNPWWVKDQCGRNTCSSVIKHNGSPDTFSHSVHAVTLQCCYVPWLMILHYKSFQNLVE